jgi:hypothetical protein
VRWLKNILAMGLLLTAVGVALATVLSDHSADYGKVPLPQGGTVHLPKGKVVVYYSQLADASDPVAQVTVPLSFQVVPAGGGAPIPISSENGDQTAEVSGQRSETVGELGAVAKLDVPSAGNYSVLAGTNATPGSTSLKFGTNAGAALLSKWKLLAGLVGAAILLVLIPTPRPGRRWEDEGGAPTGWSSDSRAPYAG